MHGIVFDLAEQLGFGGRIMKSVLGLKELNIIAKYLLLVYIREGARSSGLTDIGILLDKNTDQKTTTKTKQTKTRNKSVKSY